MQGLRGGRQVTRSRLRLRPLRTSASRAPSLPQASTAPDGKRGRKRFPGPTPGPPFSRARLLSRRRRGFGGSHATCPRQGVNPALTL